MKIVFHIGMGKTGTTSIQRALSKSEEALKAQGVQYLGMWFDLINGQYSDHTGLARFLSNSIEQMKADASKFHGELAIIQKQKKIDTFILSNESIFTSPRTFIRFARALQDFDGTRVRIVAYIRNPAKWIHSAYAQWGISHKTVSGPIPSIGEYAPSLLGQYDALKLWLADFQEGIDIRSFDKVTDVVSDFGKSIGVELKPLGRKALERKDLAELVLRREFNNSFPDQVFPNTFAEVVLAGVQKVETLDDILISMFDPAAIDHAVGSKSDLWAELSDKYGLAVGEQQSAPPIPDVNELRARVLEYLVVLTMKQSKRIHKLEVDLKDLSESRQAPVPVAVTRRRRFFPFRWPRSSHGPH